MNREIKPGDYIIYSRGDSRGSGVMEIGRVKQVLENGDAFVYYSEGETAARTPKECMCLLANAYTIRETGLGGEEARELFGGK